MRGFFLLLLLTNVAFVAWQYIQGEGEQEVVDIYHGVSMVNEGLTMLNELPPGQQPALREAAETVTAAGKPPEVAASQTPITSSNTLPANAQEKTEIAGQEKGDAGSDICLRVSGIDSRPRLEQALQLLHANGAMAIEQGEIRLKRTSYWVILPPYPNRAKADEAAAILGARQIKDFFIVRSGEYVNAVSLGVFSTRDRAKRRYQQIVGLKVRLRRPKIEAIELPAKAYFVSYKIADQASREKLARSLVKMEYDESEEISCK